MRKATHKNQSHRHHNINSFKSHFIKIQAPEEEPRKFVYQGTDNVKELVGNQVKMTRRRVVQGNIALDDSRRQSKREDKLVESDRMGISFNYQESKKKSQKRRIVVNDEREQSRVSDFRQQQGQINLPLQISDKHLVSTRNSFDATDVHFKDRKSKENKFIDIRNIVEKRSLEKKSILNVRKGQIVVSRDSVEKQGEPAAKKYRERFNQSKERFNQSKERFSDTISLNKSLEILTSKAKRTTQVSFLNQSQDRLPLYYPTDREKSKEQLKKIKMVANKYKQKVKVKMNKPQMSQTMHFQSTGQSSNRIIKPRYQICMPTVSFDDSFDNDSRDDEQSTTKEWDMLKRKVQKYQFVRKYLSDSELFMIYQYLRKNKIKKERWPLFVVDEAYKKMNCAKI